MAKGGAGKMLYFVLYIVLITELLVVITERDELQDNEKLIQEKLIGSIATSYKLPFSINVTPRQTDYNLGANEAHDATVVFETAGLVSDAEKQGALYTVRVAPGSKAPEGFPSSGLSSDDNGRTNFKIIKENGTAKFLGRFSSEGDYRFIVQAHAKRILPDYLTPNLLDLLKEKIGGEGTLDKEVNSNEVSFSISAKKQGGVKKAGAQLVL